MNLPIDISLTLRVGTVYYFQHRELTSSQPHYFVVVNAEPTSGRVILMSIITSNVEGQERRIK